MTADISPEEQAAFNVQFAKGVILHEVNSCEHYMRNPSGYAGPGSGAERAAAGLYEAARRLRVDAAFGIAVADESLKLLDDTEEIANLTRSAQAAFEVAEACKAKARELPA